MARVVQRRTNPPYLLIALAFLFVMAAALAVVFYTQKDDALIGREKDKAMYAKVATPEQAAKAELKEGRPYLDVLEGQVRDLAKVITGNETSYKDAMAKSEDAKKAFPTSGAGFTQLVAEAQTKAKTLQDQLDHARSDLKGAQEARDAAVAAQTAQLDAFKKEEESLNGKVKDSLAANEKLHQDYESHLKEIKDDNQKTVDGLNKQIAQMNSKVLAAEDKARKLDDKLAQTIQQFRTTNPPVIDIDRLAKSSKGKVVEVVDQIAYIDKGSNDHVVAGMPFSVFTPGDLTENPDPKATLTVVNVHTNTSECKIKNLKVNHPVISGDLIQNVAYDPQRTYTFVVMGNFDLHQTGKDGLEEVKDMIRRSGGKVSKDLTFRTDFLVIGEEPPQPPKPAGEANANESELYNTQMKAYKEFQDSKRNAAELYIPVLDANRFLALMGYTPDKRK